MSKLTLLCIFAALAILLPFSSAGVAAELRIVRSVHYEIETDLDDALASDCASRMDAMFDEYQRRFSAAVTIEPQKPFKAYLFKDEADYVAKIGDYGRNTGGLYDPNHHFLATFLGDRGRDELRRTLQHEAFHQFVGIALPHGLPPWLNEGMAQVYGEGMWTGKVFWLGQATPHVVRELRALLAKQRLLDLNSLISMDDERWSDLVKKDQSKSAACYAQSWALVYFLSHYKDASGDEPYRRALLICFSLLHEGCDPRDAFHKAFPDRHVLEERFNAFISTLEPTPEASMMERQSVLADLIEHAYANVADIPDDMSRLRARLHRAAFRIHYSSDVAEWDSDSDVTTYFSDHSGRLLTSHELFTERKPGSSLPDIVCRCFDQFQFRTHFYALGGHVRHEVLIEPVKNGTSITEKGRSSP